MATLEEVARSVLAAIDADAGLLLASQWVRDRYRQLVSRTKFRHLRRIGEVTVPGAITSGLATATRGSAIVTGDATAQAAWAATPAGRAIRLRTAWYEIAFADASIILVTPFAEANVVAGGYAIVDRKVALSSSVRMIGTMVHMRRRAELRSVNLLELDALDPERAIVASYGPEVFAEVGEESQVKRIEFYPYPKQDEIVRYVYWSIPLALANLSDSIPGALDPHVLREGALIDAMRFAAAKAAAAGNVEIAAYWRNEYRAQQSSWERNIQEAAAQDRGVDDITFILRALRHPARGDIRTAFDEVFSRGNRP